MKSRLAVLALALVAAVSAISASPSSAAAQCKWGCKCMDNACGCNSLGNGGRCDAGGSGCVVSGCVPVNIESVGGRRTAGLEFTPSGAVVQVVRAERAADPRSASFAGFGPAAAMERAAEPRGEQVLDGRWEYVSPGRAVARHCSGMVVAHYFDPDAADAARRRSAAITL